jgi:hypothetical protein
MEGPAPEVMMMAIQQRQRAGWCPSRTTLALLGFLAVAAFFLLAGHIDHVVAALPFLLILACPLMHLFMMHGGHGSHGQNPDDNARLVTEAEARREQR